MKTKMKFKKASLITGGLILSLGMPIGIAISCASSTTDPVETKGASVITEAILVNNDISAASSAELQSNLTGWDVAIVDSNKEVVTALVAGVNYKFRFTLQNDYVLPITLETLEVDASNPSIYYSKSTYKYVLKPASQLPFGHSLLNDYKIELNGTVIQPSASTGWDVVLVDASGSVITFIESGDLINYKFTPKTGFNAQQDPSDFTMEDNSFKSAQFSYIVSSNLFSNIELDFDNNIFSFVEDTGLVIVDEYLAPTTGLQFKIVNAMTNEVLLGINEGDTYKYQAILEDGFQLPEITGAFTYDKASKSYFTDTRTYVKELDGALNLATQITSPNWKSLAFYTDSTAIERVVVLNDPNNFLVGVKVSIGVISSGFSIFIENKINYTATDPYFYQNFTIADHISIDSDPAILTHRVVSENGNLVLQVQGDNDLWSVFDPDGWNVEFISSISHESVAVTAGVATEEYYVRFNLIDKSLIRTLNQYDLSDWDINFAQVDDSATETTFIYKTAFIVG